MIPINPGVYSIKIFHLENGKAPFTGWIKSLDGPTRARINSRIARFQDGHFGDCKFVGHGVLEARFFFGTGYRVYFSEVGDKILLLTGGDKSTQSADVVLAKKFLKFYLEDQDANKK